MNNNTHITFAGGWKQLQHAKLKETSSVIMGFPVDISWKPDGTKFFILNAVAVDEVLEFTTITKYSTIGATQTGQFTINPPESNPRGMYWLLDGTKFWVVGTGSDLIIQFNLTTPWDLNTAFNPSININPIDGGSLRDIVFINRGSTVFLTERNNDEVLEYAVGTPYDITTLNITPINILPVSSTSPNPESIVVKSDGTMMYIVNSTNNTIDRYFLPISNSLLGAFFLDSLDLSVTSIVSPQGLFIREDNGELLHITDSTTDLIYTFEMLLKHNNTIITNLGEELVTNDGDELVYA